MFPVLQIGPLALQTPGLLILLGIWVGLSVSERFSSRFNIDANHLYNLVLISLLIGIIGARLTYAVQFSSIFLSNPLNIFSLTPTMFNREAGLVVGLIAGFIYAQRKSMPFLSTLDALAPGGSVFMIFYHLANFASGDAFGSPVQLPFAVDLWGQSRHPVQLYELTAALMIAAVIIFRSQRFNKADIYQAGAYFWTFTALSALARLFFEFFRGDSTTFLGNVHVAQVIAWFILAIALWQLNKHPDLHKDFPAAPEKELDHAA